MLLRTIAAFCIIDDALQAMGHEDDPQTKVPSSVILTLAILAAMELGGKHGCGPPRLDADFDVG